MIYSKFNYFNLLHGELGQEEKGSRNFSGLSKR